MATTRTSQRNLYGLERDQLSAWVAALGAKPYHGRQIYRWIHGRRQFEPREWTDLPASLRETVARRAVVSPGSIDDRVTAEDGTIKYRLRLADGRCVEAVYMVHRERVTLCVSSQVGCALACDFCLTGRMGLLRHLHPGEIVGQIALIEQDRDLAGARYNLVFMGMGEPLHNYDGLLAAFRLLTDPEGFAMSRTRITVSTAGMAPAIERLADEPLRPRLAVSLNATTDALRDRLMPINRKYPLERLLAACHTFAHKSRERFTLEYVLLHGINDGDDDVRRLARIARSLRAKVNLIPFNAVPGLLDYVPPDRARIEGIRDALLAGGAAASIRWSKGVEARAACGQLALLAEDEDHR